MQFEWNARTQITMWFDNTEEEASLLRDYGMTSDVVTLNRLRSASIYIAVNMSFRFFRAGNKYWSGLLRDYYGPRAAIYFNCLTKSLEEGGEFGLKDWRREWIKLTNDWQNSRKTFPVKSTGNALNTSRWLFDKYLLGSASNIQPLNEAAYPRL